MPKTIISTWYRLYTSLLRLVLLFCELSLADNPRSVTFRASEVMVVLAENVCVLFAPVAVIVSDVLEKKPDFVR